MSSLLSAADMKSCGARKSVRSVRTAALILERALGLTLATPELIPRCQAPSDHQLRQGFLLLRSPSRRHSRLSDVTRYVPGVAVHQGEGNRDELVIRGVDSSANFFVNGFRDDYPAWAYSADFNRA
jgi:TonB-dependent receptor-like protein